MPLPGHAPSGLGFRPDGSLLIASTEDRQVLRYDGESVVTIADLAASDAGQPGRHGRRRRRARLHRIQAFSTAASIIRLDPDDTATVVAEDLDFPNGMVITPDRKTLIVAESLGRRLTAFTIGGPGDRRAGRPANFRRRPGRPARRHRLDAEGGVWTSMTLAHQFERITEGGVVTDRIDIGERVAIACTLGGPERRTLFLLSSTDAYPAAPDRHPAFPAGHRDG